MPFDPSLYYIVKGDTVELVSKLNDALDGLRDGTDDFETSVTTQLEEFDGELFDLQAQFDEIESDIAQVQLIARDPTAWVSAILVSRGITNIKSIVFKKAEGWERTVQASYVTETRPTGRFLGDYANATAAWAANVGGIATVSGDYYWNTTDDRQAECTTSNSSSTVIRGAQNYLPDEAAFVVSGTGTSSRLFIFDLTDPLVPMWAMATSAVSNMFPGTSGTPGFTVCTLKWDSALGRLWWGTGPSAQIGSMLGYVDFKTGILGNYSGSNFRVYAGGFESRNSAIGHKTVSAAAGYRLSADYIAGVTAYDGYLAAATSGGVSIVKPDGSTLKSSSTNAFKAVAILRGRLYAINDTASPESLIDFGPIAELTASFAAVNTWTNATVPALSASVMTASVAGNDSLAFLYGPPSGVDQLWPNPATLADSLIARKGKTFATPPMKKPEVMLMCSTVTGSLSGTELITNGGFDTDSGWTKGTGWSIAAGVASITSAAGTSLLRQSSAQFTRGGYARVSFDYTLSGGSALVYLGTSDATTISISAGSGTYSAIVETRSGDFAISVGAGVTMTVDNVSVKLAMAETDHSGKSNHATINGTLTATAHATGGVAGLSGWSDSNNLSLPYDADLDVGTGDFFYPFAFKFSANVTEPSVAIFYRGDVSASGNRLAVVALDDERLVGTINGSSVVTSTSTYNDGLIHTGMFYRKSGVCYLEIDYKVIASAANTADVSNASAVLAVGYLPAIALRVWPGTLWFVGASTVVPTAEERALMHLYMRNLIEGKAALDEIPSNISHNALTDTLHCVGTTYEQTIRDGRVTVVGSHGVGTSPVIACGPRGEVSYGGSTGLTVSVPARNIREATPEERITIKEFKFTGNSVLTDFAVDPGWYPISVYEDGALMESGATKDYVIKDAGFYWFASFAVAPGAVTVTILAEYRS